MVLLSPFQPRKDNASMLSMQTRSVVSIRGGKTKLHGGYGTRRLSTTRCDMVPGFQEKTA